MLKIGDLSKPPAVNTNYSFPLDPFQKIAIESIQKEENVMVTAKTGSGKTLIAEYQIEYSLAKGKRVFYTTPIKSLSNQKFHDLKEIYGSRVGIMTGDIKFAPQADVVILTTEILRNLLFKIGSKTENIGSTSQLSLEDVDAIVFDEFHYIMDPERGKVWEECLILLPENIKVILLSATLDNPEDFGQWLAEQKGRNVMLVSTQYRVVPLKHCVIKGTELEIVMDNKNLFYDDAYNRYIVHLENQKEKAKIHEKQVRARQAGDNAIAKPDTQKSFLHRMNFCIERLKQCNLLPALFFVFSRNQCENYAQKVEDTFLTHSESASVRNIVGFHLSRHNEDLKTMPQYHTLLKLLEKGIAFHHSGMIPLLKEIVELLFNKGLIRILFATETFAVGINMPTRTVVFTSYSKRDTYQVRMLRTDEYIQMAGRAGRRGKDTEGLVLYVPDRDPAETSDVKRMMTGRQQSMSSRLDFHYDFLIKCLQQGRDWTLIRRSSFWERLRQQEIQEIRDFISDLSKIPEVVSIHELKLRHEYESLVKSTTNASRREAQRKLEGWKNKHVGHEWEEDWKKYKEYLRNQENVKVLEETLYMHENIQNHYAEYLISMGFVKDGTLTPMGVLASEINEAHPLLLSRMYFEGHLKKLTRSELLAYISCFVEGDEDIYEYTVPPRVQEAINTTVEMSKELSSCETHEKSRRGYWNIYSYWPEVVYKWIEEREEFAILCQEYALQEGNFVKALLKLANIAEELTNICILQQDIEMLEILKDVRQEIVRGIVVPDSLYLRI